MTVNATMPTDDWDEIEPLLLSADVEKQWVGVKALHTIIGRDPERLYFFLQQKSSQRQVEQILLFLARLATPRAVSVSRWNALDLLHRAKRTHVPVVVLVHLLLMTQDAALQQKLIDIGAVELVQDLATGFTTHLHPSHHLVIHELKAALTELDVNPLVVDHVQQRLATVHRLLPLVIACHDRRYVTEKGSHAAYVALSHSYVDNSTLSCSLANNVQRDMDALHGLVYTKAISDPGSSTGFTIEDLVELVKSGQPDIPQVTALQRDWSSMRVPYEDLESEMRLIVQNSQDTNNTAGQDVKGAAIVGEPRLHKWAKKAAVAGLMTVGWLVWAQHTKMARENAESASHNKAQRVLSRFHRDKKPRLHGIKHANRGTRPGFLAAFG